MSGRSWPIWNRVLACRYKSSKSFGWRDTGEVEVRVGTGPSVSEVLVRHFTTRREIDDLTIFRFGYCVPGQEPVVVAEKRMITKTRKFIEHDAR
jgi:hypothetical protein